MTRTPWSQPNILLVMADQLGPPFLLIHGHSVARAPATERLASHGFVFDAAYANSPLCAPARFAMMTGQRNSRIGAYDNASELPASVPSFAHLRALGTARRSPARCTSSGRTSCMGSSAG